VAAEDEEKGKSLAAAMGADTRKLAAISAAVGTYMAQAEPKEKV